MAMKWRDQYDDEAHAELRDLTRIDNFGPSLTQQHHTPEADLNVIMARFGLDPNKIPAPAIDPSAYGDFTDVVDMKESLDRVRAATEAWEALPGAIRAKFNHNPLELFAWINDKNNHEEAVKMGFLTKDVLPKKAEAAVSANNSPSSPQTPAPQSTAAGSGASSQQPAK